MGGGGGADDKFQPRAIWLASRKHQAVSLFYEEDIRPLIWHALYKLR